MRVLETVGFRLDRQTGSHIVLRREGAPAKTLSVPDHKEVRRGTLRAIIRQAGLSVESFNGLRRSRRR